MAASPAKCSIAQALTVACPSCLSPAEQHCTRPTDNSRVEVMWVHYARETAYVNRDQA